MYILRSFSEVKQPSYSDFDKVNEYTTSFPGIIYLLSYFLFLQYQVAIGCVFLGFAVCTGTLFLTEQLEKGWYLVSICLIYFFYGGIWAIMPSALAKLLGAKNMAVNYGIISSGSVCMTNEL